MDFEVKGDPSAEKNFEFYKKAGHDVTLTITESDETIEEFEEHQKEYREGLKRKINPDVTVEVDDPNQMTLEEAAAAADDPMDGVNEINDDLPF
ncbi:hypothetical protein [Paenibacillus lutimineralis]|uniref:Uncharacterized protein n=1 Tax=Paenibacillus lutimineralis TaxID=2707005 RepID=A0A3Q9IAF8_9BACL|nr:hypothetical protein [Paenibacillus lutimineralis]AZS16457.1 hypothetical protein EI981_19715 [Paenibacillus lutimineralis]